MGDIYDGEWKVRLMDKGLILEAHILESEKTISNMEKGNIS